jgi:hypothetical protein
MSFSTQNDLVRNAGAIDAEKTLRLIASLPAPEGIEDRVKSGLRGAERQARVMSWPLSTPVRGGGSGVSAMRAAAAAAIVFVVAGGGWEVYSHIRLAPAPTAVAAPQQIGGGGGLSAAGAKRTPRTLEGPVIANPASVKQRAGEVKSGVLPQVHTSRPAAVKSKATLPSQQ